MKFKTGTSVLMVFAIVFACIAVFPLASSARLSDFSNSNSAIVIGSNQDRSAAEVIQQQLGFGGTNVSGDVFEWGRTTNRLDLGESLTDIRSARITRDDLPNLLRDDTFRNERGDTFDYTQEITLSPNLNLTVFEDNDINNDDPTIGIRIPDGSSVLNYTLEFDDTATSNIDNNRLVDFENSQIEILGQTYTILSATASDNRFEIVSSSTSATLNVDEQRTFIVNNTALTVQVIFIDSNEAVLQVNGVTSPTLQQGESFEVNGVTIVVTDILFQNFQNGIQRVEITLGSSPIILEDGQELEFTNENNVINNFIVHIDSTTTGDTYNLNRIRFEWDASNDLFIAENVPQDHEVIMPGFSNFMITLDQFVTPANENLLIQNDGANVMSLKVSVDDSKNTAFTLPILSTDGGTSFVALGGDNVGDRLVTSTNNTIVWDDNVDNFMVASWNDGTTAESFILRLDVGTQDRNSIVNFRNLVSGETKEDVRVGDTATFGDVELTVVSIDNTTDSATLSINADGNFDRLYTKEGLTIVLPVDSTGTELGAINLASNSTNYTLTLIEEDKDGNIAQGTQFAFSIVINSDDQVEVGNLLNQSILAGGVFDTLENDNDLRVGWVRSPLASELELDTSSDQGFARVIYHGAESYGRVFVGSGVPTGSLVLVPIIFTSDINSTEFSGMDMIVVGGPCVNSLAASLLGVSFTTCDGAFTTATGIGSGKYLLQSYNQNNRTQILVAGYETADTLAGSEFLTNNPNTQI